MILRIDKFLNDTTLLVDVNASKTRKIPQLNQRKLVPLLKTGVSSDHRILFLSYFDQLFGLLFLKIEELVELIKPGVGAVFDGPEDAIIYLLILQKLIRTSFNNLLLIFTDLFDRLLFELDLRGAQSFLDVFIFV